MFFIFPINLILAFSSSIIKDIKKRLQKESFLLVTTEGEQVGNQIKMSLKISFISKSDCSLLKILLAILFIKKFKINLRSLVSDYLTFFPKRLEK